MLSLLFDALNNEHELFIGHVSSDSSGLRKKSNLIFFQTSPLQISLSL